MAGSNLFDLSIFENAQDDIMNSSITEGSDEFDSNSNAKEGTDGMKEVGVSIPAGTEIDADVYNKALTQLQNTFNEAASVIDMLKNVDPVSVTLEARQEAYTEACIADAIYNSIINGPVFEAVESSDKNDVKSIITKISKDVEAAVIKAGNKFSKPQLLVRYLLTGGLTGRELKVNGTGKITYQTRTWWNTRLWSILGVLYCEPDDEAAVVETLNTLFAKELGDYKIKSVTVNAGILELFRNKFGYKNVRKGYWLLIDKPTAKPSVKELETAIKSAADDGKDDDKDEK